MVFRYLVMAWPNLYNSVLKITTYFYFIIILLFFRRILLSSLANITLPGQNIDKRSAYKAYFACIIVFDQHQDGV